VWDKHAFCDPPVRANIATFAGQDTKSKTWHAPQSHFSIHSPTCDTRDTIFVQGICQNAQNAATCSANASHGQVDRTIRDAEAAYVTMIRTKENHKCTFHHSFSYSKSSGLLTGDALDDELSVAALSPATPGARLRLFRMRPPVLAPVACVLPPLTLSRSGSRVLTGA
jgi:hypothetical protein